MKGLGTGLAVLLLVLLPGCAMVKVEARGPDDYIAQTRGDVLSTGKLSQAGRETLQVAGQDPEDCLADVPTCSRALDAIVELGDERRLATQAELWAAAGLTADATDRRVRSPAGDAALQAWLETARRAYAYLFFTARRPSERAFEERQNQVRDYYNYATLQVAAGLYPRWRAHPQVEGNGFRVGAWTVRLRNGGLALPGGVERPQALVPAASLAFAGLRSTYRRDGFGAEMVAQVAPRALGDPAAAAADAVTGPGDGTEAAMIATAASARSIDAGLADVSEIPDVAVTVLLQFMGDDLDTVLASDQAEAVVYAPDRQPAVKLHGQHVPLAANFTAPYGLWLADSGFARQSLRSLFGFADGIDRPHLYLMQPFDPQRRIVLLLHGLASSPEAWVNLANEIMGDPLLRTRYQIWQVYYPTNLPVAWNRAQIQALVERSLRRFDPDGSTPASRHMVLIGHSMGGLIGRLLVSSSGDQVWNALMGERRLTGERGQRVRERLQPLLRFQPLPQVDRAVFIAAPQRGTEAAGGRLGRLVARLVSLPVTLLDKFGDVLRDLSGAGQADDGTPPAVPNSIDNLRADDPFVRAVADLPLAAGVRYDTIIARRDPKVPLAESDDGVVPYWSAHMPGAESEQVITSWHSVQETPQAILAIRRILHRALADGAAPATR